MIKNIFYLLTLALFFWGCKDESKKPYVQDIQTVNEPMHYALGENALSQIIAQNSNIPYLAAYYGVDAIVELEFMIDTNGNIEDVRLLREEMATTMPQSEKKDEVLQKLIGKFAADAEIALWKTSGQWVPKTELSEKKVSKMVKEFTFNTLQNQKTAEALSSNEEVTFGNYIENGSIQIDADRYYAMGVKLLSEGKAFNAAKFFSASVNLMPGFVDAWFNRGLCFSAINKPALACQSWKVAAQLGDEEAKKLVSETCNN